MNEFEQYYIDKLTSICNGRVPKYLDSKFFKVNKKTDGITYDDEKKEVQLYFFIFNEI